MSERHDESQLDEENVLSQEAFQQEAQPEWDQKKFRRMVWKTRLRLFRTIVLSVIGLVLIYGVYIASTNIYYDRSHKPQQFTQYVSTLVELHGGGIRVHDGLEAPTELSPWLTETSTMKLYQPVGDWNVVVGEVVATRDPAGNVSYEIKRESLYLDNDPSSSLSFNMYGILHQDGASKIVQDDNGVFKQMNKIEDGYVAELAFSTKVGMTPEQLRKLLEPYDLHVTGMAVYAGEIQQFHPSTYGAGEGSISSSHLMLRPMVRYTEDGNGKAQYHHMNNEDDLERSVQQFMEDLEWMTSVNSYSGQELDRKRLFYLREKGVQVFGAIVTGPVRELEKLKQEADLGSFDLGRIEVWKWSGKSREGS